jgi:hypothetical protein
MAARQARGGSHRGEGGDFAAVERRGQKAEGFQGAWRRRGRGFCSAQLNRGLGRGCSGRLPQWRAPQLELGRPGSSECRACARVAAAVDSVAVVAVAHTEPWCTMLCRMSRDSPARAAVRQPVPLYDSPCRCRCRAAAACPRSTHSAKKNVNEISQQDSPSVAFGAIAFSSEGHRGGSAEARGADFEVGGVRLRNAENKILHSLNSATGVLVSNTQYAQHQHDAIFSCWRRFPGHSGQRPMLSRSGRSGRSGRLGSVRSSPVGRLRDGGGGAEAPISTPPGGTRRRAHYASPRLRQP